MACSPVPCCSQRRQQHTGVWRRVSDAGEEEAEAAGALWPRARSQAEAALSLRPTVRRQADNMNSKVRPVEEEGQSFPRPTEHSGKLVSKFMVHIVHFRQDKDKGMPVGDTASASSACGATQPFASED